MPKKRQPIQMTVADLISGGLADIADLRQEIDDWKSNLEGSNMEHLPKYEEVSSCYDELENVPEEIDTEGLPRSLLDHKLDVIDPFPMKKRGISRAKRSANAINLLSIAKGYLEDQVDKLKEDEAEKANEVIEALEEAIGNAENAQFPGMY